MAVAAFAKAKLASYAQAKPRTHRTHALGDRALPDLISDANAADPLKRVALPQRSGWVSGMRQRGGSRATRFWPNSSPPRGSKVLSSFAVPALGRGV